MDEAIQKVLNSPSKKYTKEEAVEMLQRLGVLDQNGKVTPEYEHIFVRKKETNE